MPAKRSSSKQPRRRDAQAGVHRKRALASLGVETDHQLEALILRRLALPIEARMNFLRKRLPGGGSCL